MKFLKSAIVLALVVVSLSSGLAASKETKKKNKFIDSGAAYDSTELVSDIKVVKVKFDGRTFLVKERKSQINRGDCNLCHSKQVKSDTKEDSNELLKGKTNTHQNIELVHAAKQGMSCQTCHGDPSVDILRNPNNNDKIDFNFAFLSCQGCHFSQVKDWAGGAHGKRVKIWANPRIIYNCTECHDPHDPSFKSRIPKTISTLPEK